MSMTQVNRCPVAHAASQVEDPSRQGLALLNDSFAVVRAVFADWEPRSEIQPGGIRGGSERERRKPQANRDTVESSFAPEEHAYVRLIAAGLDHMARGRLFGRSEMTVPLSDRIEQAYIAAGPQAVFRPAVYTSTIGLFEEFGGRYPNLTPALSAMFKGGGLGGTSLASYFASNALYNALMLQRDDELDPKTYLDELVGRLRPREFVGISHDSTYEVHCPASAFARRVVHSAGEAALRLAKRPDVQDDFDRIQAIFMGNIQYQMGTHAQIQEVIEASFTTAKQAVEQS